MGTQPASATILLDRSIDAQQMAEIVALTQTRPGVIAATGRTQFTSDVEVNGQLREIPLQVFVVPPDDPLRMARFYPLQRTWPPSASEIFIGRDSLALLRVAVDDTVTVQAPSGDRLQWQVADTV
jgi:putative ABC transport system permease protein